MKILEKIKEAFELKDELKEIKPLDDQDEEPSSLTGDLEENKNGN